MAKKTLVFVCLCLFIAVGYTQEYGYPNQWQREYRRYPSQQFQFNQNSNPQDSIIVIEYEPYNRPVNSFNNRPKQYYYDEYGRPVQQNRPFWQQQPTWGNQNNGQFVNFPENVATPATNEGLGVNFPEDKPSSTLPFTEPNNLPPLQPEPEVAPTLPALTPAAIDSEPVFTVPETTTLPPLTPVEPTQDNGSAFTQASTTLPPLTPVPTSESRNNFNFQPPGLFNEPCQLDDGSPGNCIPLTNCEEFSKLLLQAKSDPTVVAQLRRAHCGFEGNNPKVCCPALSIPVEPPPVPTNAPQPIPTEPPPEPKSVDLDSEYVAKLPDPPECGNSTATLSRVVGGVDAKLGDFPWMALLGYKRRTGVGWLCGGSLVSSKHVLTAAHCVYGRENTLYVVRLGELDLDKTDEGAFPLDLLIKKMTIHEKYDSSSISNDIAMLLLEKTVQFTDLIRPICIPTSQQLRSNNFENYNPLIAGWGSLEWKGPSATILQVLQLPVVSNTFCQEKFRQYKQISIDERVLCAGYKKGGKDACQGDSGGPLMQPIWGEDYSTYFYQIGVVSFGKKCAEPGIPGVYTRVTTFIPWIAEKTLGPTAAARYL